jgi:hypothetical protein
MMPLLMIVFPSVRQYLLFSLSPLVRLLVLLFRRLVLLLISLIFDSRSSGSLVDVVFLVRPLPTRSMHVWPCRWFAGLRLHWRGLRSGYWSWSTSFSLCVAFWLVRSRGRSCVSVSVCLNANALLLKVDRPLWSATSVCLSLRTGMITHSFITRHRKSLWFHDTYFTIQWFRISTHCAVLVWRSFLACKSLSDTLCNSFVVSRLRFETMASEMDYRRMEWLWRASRIGCIHWQWVWFDSRSLGCHISSPQTTICSSNSLHTKGNK